jgi:hypothetical protein
LRSFLALCLAVSLELARPKQLSSREAMLEPENPIADEMLLAVERQLGY